MLKQEPGYPDKTGELLPDEWFAPGLGVSVLFEDLNGEHHDDIEPVTPSPAWRFEKPNRWVWAEAAKGLVMIGTNGVLVRVQKMTDDPDSQLTEVGGDVLREVW